MEWIQLKNPEGKTIKLDGFFGVNKIIEFANKELGQYWEIVDSSRPERIPEFRDILKSQLCTWSWDIDGFYETICGNAHIFIHGGLADNKYKYCPYCGKQIYLITNEED